MPPRKRNTAFRFFGAKLQSVIASNTQVSLPTENNVTTFGSESKLTEYEILPRETDIDINNWLEPHHAALNKSVPAKDKLFLFFSGSFGKTANNRLIVRLAANNGYHAINLRYPNSWSVGRLCSRTDDANCFEKVRLEILDGTNRSDRVNISRANSIENRLIKLLLYLHAQHPDEGWLKYLEGNAPKWSSMIIAGHSQGGGQAAIIAKEYVVARVVMLGAPSDYSRALDTPAPWLYEPHATPADRYYGFTHANDSGASRQLQAWKALGMAAYGPVINVDNKQFPYNNSHQLVTSVMQVPQTRYHGSLAVDAYTPLLSDGTPIFQDVWQYLCCP